MPGGHRKERTWVFFTDEEVIKSVSKASREQLSKFGAHVRSDAKHSIRKRKKDKGSKPGTPPHSHTGNLKKNIFFGYDRAKESVVVGPLKNRSGNAPEVLEYGGTSWSAPAPKVFKIGDRGPIGFSKKTGKPRYVEIKTAEQARRASVLYREYYERRDAEQTENGKKFIVYARPYMTPAFERNEPQAPQLWRDSVKK